MKKMISLAVILSCVLSVPALPMARTTAIARGSQRCGRTVRTMMGMRRRADLTRIIRATMTSVARIATVMTNAIRHVMSRTISPWRGNDFRKGHPAPAPFRGDEYRVRDWSDRGLPPPPEGHHWSHIDGNYVLIAAATGIITSILVSGALGH